MKITDPGIIKNGEKDLIELLKEDLDLDAVREIIQKKMTSAALSPKGGEIVVHDNQIAFRMDFDLCLSGSLMFDRQGNHIPESDELFDSTTDLSKNAEEDPLDQEDILSGEKTDLDLPDYDLAPLNDLDVLDELDDLTDEPETDLKEEGDLFMNELADDDMTDILKESRDFWEKKKDS
ncbi:MAG: hypothetical protein M0T82_07845 [Desulfobacteraceae bacterium]|nr:hypothetical protein [Desulfobacteraceae bacterium]